MIRYCIIDRRMGAVRNADWIQVRDKDLCARALTTLVRQAMGMGPKVLVNTRVDVALAARAAGVHLPSGSIAPSEWRGMVPEGFLIGVSCHFPEEVLLAEEEGADYALFGPVFAPLSKTSALSPRGLEKLREVCASVKIPVLALGGITWENAEDCAMAGAAGIAGITLFKDPN